MQAREILSINPVVPVISTPSAQQALELAKALLAGGVRVLEITLRTSAALDAISLISAQLSEAIVGAGTVLNAKQLKAAKEAGARFAISPGLNEGFLRAAASEQIALIPGIATPSELMLGLSFGIDTFKLFPATQVGGVGLLKALAAPFSGVKFCPTGGINAQNAPEYLALENVICVGSSYLADPALLDAKDYAAITKLAAQSLLLR